LQYIGKLDRHKIGAHGKNIQLVIKLSTGIDKKRDKNSILTLWKIRNSAYKQLIKNKKILSIIF